MAVTGVGAVKFEDRRLPVTVTVSIWGAGEAPVSCAWAADDQNAANASVETVGNNAARETRLFIIPPVGSGIGELNPVNAASNVRFVDSSALPVLMPLERRHHTGHPNDFQDLITIMMMMYPKCIGGPG